MESLTFINTGTNMIFKVIEYEEASKETLPMGTPAMAVAFFKLTHGSPAAKLCLTQVILHCRQKMPNSSGFHGLSEQVSRRSIR